MNKVFIRKFLPYFIVALGFIYGLWPIDLIPDIPVIGWIDDIGVLGTTILIALKLYSRNKKEMTKEKNNY